MNGTVKIYLGEFALSSYAHAIYADTHEADERAIVARNLAPDDVVLEIGAGIGIVSLACCRIAGSDRVHVCEANARLEPILRRNFALNNFAPELIMGLVSLDSGTQEFYVSDRFIMSSRYAPAQVECESVQKKVLPTVPLNGLIERIRPSFLIMDVEGAEVDLMDPRVILTSVRKICMETHPHIVGDEAVTKLVQSMQTRGFRLRWSESRNHVLFFERDLQGDATRKIC
mgnify:CR=1 FL=1